MGMFSRSADEKAASAAHRELNDYSDSQRRAGNHEPDATYERLNEAAAAADDKVSWWRK